MPTLPYIPDSITVHLGRPDDQSAQNVTIPFTDYIKNVASSEIYPTWPQAALRANILAQISFALNRVYTEWYRSRGYDFDITNSTAYDQSFVYGRDIFENINTIVDEIFDSYLRRDGSIEPLFAAYCDGVEVSCPGLSQTGTVTLANQGYTPLEIIRYYFGNDVNLVTDAPVGSFRPSYPGRPLILGDTNNSVQQMQIRLNRIAKNYPSIPRIGLVNGEFNQSTLDAVTAFQRVFNLTPDGVVGPATWYRIAYIYTSVKRLAELDSEGLENFEIPSEYPDFLREGDSGRIVRDLQYMLAVVADYYPEVRPIEYDGFFGPETAGAVRDFQALAGLPVDGIVGPDTWRQLYPTYLNIVDTYGVSARGISLYPGLSLSLGARGEDVTTLQRFLARISQSIEGIPSVTPDGVFGPNTERAVIALQNLYGLNPTGVVGPLTWDAAATLYADLTGEVIGTQPQQ